MMGLVAVAVAEIVIIVVANFVGEVVLTAKVVVAS